MKKAAFLLLFLYGTAHAQDFPQTFIGRWQGTLQWYKGGEKTPQQVPMQLYIQPGDTLGQYTWQIIYGKKSEDNRPYLLKPIDKAKGHWVIDERNGIVLDQYWVGNKFCGAFTVQQSTIVNNYWLEGMALMVEFYSLSAKPVNTTGGTDKDTPPVDSYAIRSYQKAVLYRKK